MQRQRGFTLLELMVVVLILGGLIAIVAPNITRQVRSARIETARAQMARMGEAIQVYHLEKKRLPDSLEVLTEPDPRLGEALLAHIPPDPLGQRLRLPAHHPEEVRDPVLRTRPGVRNRRRSAPPGRAPGVEAQTDTVRLRQRPGSYMTASASISTSASLSYRRATCTSVMAGYHLPKCSR